MEPVTTRPATSPNHRSSAISRSLLLLTDSRPDSLTTARRCIRETLSAAGLSPDATSDMEIAASEVLTNTHRHAYPGIIGPVFVEVFQMAIAMAVLVIDHGRAVEAVPIPRSVPTRTTTGGRGLYLASQLVDDYSVTVGAAGHGLVALLLKWRGGQRPRPPRTGDVNQGRPVGTAMALSAHVHEALHRSSKLIATSEQTLAEARTAIENATMEYLEHRIGYRPSASW